MHIKGRSLDDLLYQALKRTLKSKTETNSTKGPAKELLAVQLTLEDPRARFSRTERRGTLFSCLGETLWYFSGTDRLDVIEHYIPAYRKFIAAKPEATAAPGAYGPRLFGKPSQVHTLIETLKRKPDTRQAVAQIFAASDFGSGDVPCTCTLQFFVRHGRLHTITNMRSNDAYLGLPHDVFAFTWLQEVVARSVGVEVGEYHHVVGSLHLYKEHYPQASQYLDEGWQEKIAMPAMPLGDPWSSIAWLLDAEQRTRLGLDELQCAAVAPYWQDLGRLLQINRSIKAGDKRGIVLAKRQMSSQAYDAHIRFKSKPYPADSKTPLLDRMSVAQA
jgi:thymidylate synthase